MQNLLGTSDLSSMSTSIGKHKKTKYYKERRRSKTGNPKKTQKDPSAEESLGNMTDDKKPMTMWDPDVIQKTGKWQQSVCNNTTTTREDLRPPTIIHITERPRPIDKPITKPRDPLTMHQGANIDRFYIHPHKLQMLR
jgi:hypothetical protein